MQYERKAECVGTDKNKSMKKEKNNVNLSWCVWYTTAEVMYSVMMDCCLNQTCLFLFFRTSHQFEDSLIYWVCKLNNSVRPETLRIEERSNICIFLTFNIGWLWLSHLSCAGCCNRLSYLHSLFMWPALSLVLSDPNTPPHPHILSPPPLSACWWLLAIWRQGGTCDRTSCSPGDGCAVFLGLHPQRSYAGGLAVWIHVEVITVDSPADPSTPKKAAHVCLSHVAAPWTGHAQEVRDTARAVRMRGHAGGHRIARHNAAWHWRGSTAAPNPRGVLDLEKNNR